jgi:cytochrome b-561
MIAHALCPVLIGLAVWWVKSIEVDKMFLGGLGWALQTNAAYVFNWHPLLMVAAVVAETQAILTYRTWPFSKPTNKYIHIFWHMCAVACLGLGLKAVWRYKNLKALASLYSLHSWIGLAVVVMVFAQFALGFLVFSFPVAAPAWRRAYLPLHGFFGCFMYMSLCLNVVLGIVNKTTSQGCGYDGKGFVTGAGIEDTNPAKYYKDIYLGCRVSYGLAVTTITVALCAMYATMDLKAAAAPRPKDRDEKSALSADVL